MSALIRGRRGAVRLGLAITALLMAVAAAGAQAPGGGMDARPGFGEHRPPFERAFGPRGDHGRWWNNPKVVEKLKLTEAQRKSMDATLLEHREKLIDLRASLEKAELAMEPLIADDQPNEGRILAQIDKVAQARAELEKANARFLLAIRGKLTPEQWKQVQAFRENHGPMHHGFRAEGRGPNQQGPGSRNHQTPPPPPGPQGMLGEGPGPDGAEALEPGIGL